MKETSLPEINCNHVVSALCRGPLFDLVVPEAGQVQHLPWAYLTRRGAVPSQNGTLHTATPSSTQQSIIHESLNAPGYRYGRNNSVLSPHLGNKGLGETRVEELRKPQPGCLRIPCLGTGQVEAGHNCEHVQMRCVPQWCVYGAFPCRWCRFAADLVI